MMHSVADAIVVCLTNRCRDGITQVKSSEIQGTVRNWVCANYKKASATSVDRRWRELRDELNSWPTAPRIRAEEIPVRLENGKISKDTTWQIKSIDGIPVIDQREVIGTQIELPGMPPPINILKGAITR